MLSGKQVLGVLMVISVSMQGLLCLHPVDIEWFWKYDKS